MLHYVQNVIDSYNSLFIDKRDKRVDGWLFMSSPFPTLALCLGYVYLVKVIGPQFMKNRDPFQFRRLLVVYNAIQVLFSLWIVYELGQAGWFGKYSFRCEPVDYSDDPAAVRMTHAAWWYYFSKFTEFMDTIFFILRKKFEHVSTLHVIHHGIMPMSVWFGVKFTPGGHSTFFGLCNSVVHIVMYFYYMMTALGPQYAKYLWWKRYLTTLQMVQFVLIFVHAFQLGFTDCNYPRAFMWWIGSHAVLFFFLFSDFYKKAYLKKKERAAAARQGRRSGPEASFSSIVPCILHEDLSNGHAGETLKQRSKGNGSIMNGHGPSTSLPNGHLKELNGHAKSNGQATNGYISNGVLPNKKSPKMSKKRD